LVIETCLKTIDSLVNGKISKKRVLIKISWDFKAVMLQIYFANCVYVTICIYLMNDIKIILLIKIFKLNN